MCRQELSLNKFIILLLFLELKSLFLYKMSKLLLLLIITQFPPHRTLPQFNSIQSSIEILQNTLILWFIRLYFLQLFFQLLNKLFPINLLFLHKTNRLLQLPNLIAKHTGRITNKSKTILQLRNRLEQITPLIYQLTVTPDKSKGLLYLFQLKLTRNPKFLWTHRVYPLQTNILNWKYISLFLLFRHERCFHKLLLRHLHKYFIPMPQSIDLTLYPWYLKFLIDIITIFLWFYLTFLCIIKTAKYFKPSFPSR